MNIRVRRDGDRDISFEGKLLATGTIKIKNGELQISIWRTKAGKYVTQEYHTAFAGINNPSREKVTTLIHDTPEQVIEGFKVNGKLGPLSKRVLYDADLLDLEIIS